METGLIRRKAQTVLAVRLSTRPWQVKMDNKTAWRCGLRTLETPDTRLCSLLDVGNDRNGDGAASGSLPDFLPGICHEARGS